MAITWKLGVTSAAAVTISPMWDLTRPKKQVRSDARGRSGKLFIRNWYNYQTFDFGLDYVPASVANVINSLWSTNTAVFLFIESGSGVEVHSCMMINDESPLASYSVPYDDLYRGTIKLEEVSP